MILIRHETLGLFKSGQNFLMIEHLIAGKCLTCHEMSHSPRRRSLGRSPSYLNTPASSVSSPTSVSTPNDSHNVEKQASGEELMAWRSEMVLQSTKGKSKQRRRAVSTTDTFTWKMLRDVWRCFPGRPDT